MGLLPKWQPGDTLEIGAHSRLVPPLAPAASSPRFNAQLPAWVEALSHPKRHWLPSAPLFKVGKYEKRYEKNSMKEGYSNVWGLPTCVIYKSHFPVNSDSCFSEGRVATSFLPRYTLNFFSVVWTPWITIYLTSLPLNLPQRQCLLVCYFHLPTYKPCSSWLFYPEKTVQSLEAKLFLRSLLWPTSVPGAWVGVWREALGGFQTSGRLDQPLVPPESRQHPKLQKKRGYFQTN